MTYSKVGEILWSTVHKKQPKQAYSTLHLPRCKVRQVNKSGRQRDYVLYTCFTVMWG
jgi:hypothetical protein